MFSRIREGLFAYKDYKKELDVIVDEPFVGGIM